MKTKARYIRDSYLDLVREFPLVPIRNQEQYDSALVFLKKLAIRDEASLDPGERDYLDTLSQFVGDYEDERFRSEIAPLKPRDALKHLMRESDMTPADLGRVLGNRSLASQILRGKRGLSKTHIRRLSERFKVAPGVFFE
jgi:HTH-type transcriptional regulator / antitoxin HigA